MLINELGPSQQQDNLVKSYPGTAYIITRPKSHRSGGAGSPYPYDVCQDFLNYYYDVRMLLLHLYSIILQLLQLDAEALIFL